MDYIQLLGKAAHYLEATLQKLHAFVAGLTLIAPALASALQEHEHSLKAFETLIHQLHWYAALGFATQSGILLLRYALRKIVSASDARRTRRKD